MTDKLYQKEVTMTKPSKNTMTSKGYDGILIGTDDGSGHMSSASSNFGDLPGHISAGASLGHVLQS